MAGSGKYSPDVHERFVRLMQEHTDAHDSQGAAIAAVALTVG